MPATPKQMRAAGRELRLRREGQVEQEASRAEATRPMGAMSERNLEAYASWPDPLEQRMLAKLELWRRELGGKAIPGGDRFRAATDETVEFYATATDDEIRHRNGQG